MKTSDGMVPVIRCKQWKEEFFKKSTQKELKDKKGRSCSPHLTTGHSANCPKFMNYLKKGDLILRSAGLMVGPLEVMWLHFRRLATWPHLPPFLVTWPCFTENELMLPIFGEIVAQQKTNSLNNRDVPLTTPAHKKSCKIRFSHVAKPISQFITLIGRLHYSHENHLYF